MSILLKIQASYETALDTRHVTQGRAACTASFISICAAARFHFTTEVHDLKQLKHLRHTTSVHISWALLRHARVGSDVPTCLHINQCACTYAALRNHSQDAISLQPLPYFTQPGITVLPWRSLQSPSAHSPRAPSCLLRVLTGSYGAAWRCQRKSCACCTVIQRTPWRAAGSFCTCALRAVDLSALAHGIISVPHCKRLQLEAVATGPLGPHVGQAHHALRAGRDAQLPVFLRAVASPS